jgi:hypothetical protein
MLIRRFAEGYRKIPGGLVTSSRPAGLSFQTSNNDIKMRTRGNIMELLVPLGIVGVWLLLQIWILPKLGVRT